MSAMTDESNLHFQHSTIVKRIKTILSTLKAPSDKGQLQQQYIILEEFYKNIQTDDCDKRRQHRGSREQKLPQGCRIRQRLLLSNKKDTHELILVKKGNYLVDEESGRNYTSLNKANEEHYITCGKVWTTEDSEKNPKHKVGCARNPVSAWGDGKNAQGFYALRKDTSDTFDIPIINMNDEDWFDENIKHIHHSDTD